MMGAATRAGAQTRCPVAAWGTPALGELDARARLRFIRDQLAHDAHYARIWQASWIGIYGASTTANVVGLALSNNETDYIDWGLGVGSSVVGLLTSAIPRKVMGDSLKLAQRIGDSPRGEDPCVLVAEAERVLLRDADDEAFNSGWLAHTFAFTFNIGIGVALAAIGHLQEAFIHGFSGLIVGELTVITAPRGAVNALRHYRLGQLQAPPRATVFHWSLAPQVTPGRYVMSLALAF
jgi:hypothetical protein